MEVKAWEVKAVAPKPIPAELVLATMALAVALVSASIGMYMERTGMIS